MQIKHVGPFSAFKIGAALYAAFGLIFGAIFSVFSIVGAGIAGAAGDDPAGAIAGMMFGVGGIIILPLFYGLIGGVSSAVMAAIYNLLAGWIGGLEIELE